MDNVELQKRVREQRTKQGMSQEELAERSQLSLRTIQRIENGESTPRGDTLKRLSVALQVSPEELIDWQVQEDHNLLSILNLSQLTFLGFPLLGVIIPLIIWILKKDKVKDVDRVGQSILNFQISLNLLFFTSYSLGLLVILLLNNVPDWLFHAFVIFTGGLYIYLVFMVILNTIRHRKGAMARYGPSIKFLQ